VLEFRLALPPALSSLTAFKGLPFWYLPMQVLREYWLLNKDVMLIHSVMTLQTVHLLDVHFYTAC